MQVILKRDAGDASDEGDTGDTGDEGDTADTGETSDAGEISLRREEHTFTISVESNCISAYPTRCKKMLENRPEDALGSLV